MILLLILQIGHMFVRYFKMGIPVGVDTGLHNAFIRYPVSAFLSRNPGEIDFMFGPLLIDHQYMDQVFIDGSVQVVHT